MAIWGIWVKYANGVKRTLALIECQNHYLILTGLASSNQ